MRILLIADLHIGSIKEIPYVYDVVTDIIDNEIALKKTDLVVFLGDYFDRLFKVNEEYVSLAINIMSYLIRTCRKTKTKIRMIYGTESHEMNQYRLFNYHLNSSSVDLKIIDTVIEEEINGKNILYVPEEYITDKHQYYKDTLYSKKYDYIFGHGVIVEGMPMATAPSPSSAKEKQVPRFNTGELSVASTISVFGHYHCHVNMGNDVYYLGSLFRDSFGEEDPKGYGIIEDDSFTFIENKAAYVYKTYEFDVDSSEKSSDELLKEIDRIKEENPEVFNGSNIGKIRIIFRSSGVIDQGFKENLKDILFSDKNIVPMIKESSEVAEEIKDSVEEEYEFILDNSMNVIEKIYRYMTKQYEDPMSLEKLTSYLEKSLL